MIRFTATHADQLHIAKWAIIAIYCDKSITYIECEGSSTFQVKETVEEALRLWESTE